MNGKYSAENLDSTLKSTLGDTWLSETRGPELLVPSYCITLQNRSGLMETGAEHASTFPLQKLEGAGYEARSGRRGGTRF